MGREPRRARRRDQPRDTPGDPGSGRRVPSRGAQRDWQRGFPWLEEERRRSQSAEEWLTAFGVSEGERPAVTGSAPSRSHSRHPEAGQPSSARLAVPPGSGRTAAGYPAERYGRGEASGPEGGNGGASGSGERFAGQRGSAEPSAARRFARPEAAPIGPRTPGVTGAGSAAAVSEAGRPYRAGAAAPGARTASQPDLGQATREPREPGRGLSQRRGPGSLPRPNPRTAPVPGERGLRGPEPGRAPSPGRHARGDPAVMVARSRWLDHNNGRRCRHPVASNFGSRSERHQQCRRAT